MLYRSIASLHEDNYFDTICNKKKWPKKKEVKYCKKKCYCVPNVLATGFLKHNA